MKLSEALLWCAVYVVGTWSRFGSGTKCSWENCPKLDPDMLNVHMVSHSHDDAGWLKTVDQYYYGSRPEITIDAVQYILDGVMTALEQDPRRKFSQCETAFFWRWWQQQTDSRRHQVTALVNNGQLEFINGGWVQNDEAATHYVAIVDQMTLGLEKLNQTFGRCARPQIGWQIDPFGHSREMANLYAQMGMKAVFFERLHYLEKEKLIEEKNLEMIWHGSDDDPTSKLLVGIFYGGYQAPPGFCFGFKCRGTPIMDDPRLEGYNKDEMVDKFLNYVNKMAIAYRTNNVMILNGDDFQYGAANWWFKNIDKLIEHANERQSQGSKVNLVYSTPTCYLQAIQQAMNEEGFDVKTGDFFPYANSEHQYWTGYFTSRPTFKGFIRQMSSLLQVCKQIDAHAHLGPSDFGDIEVLKRAVALNQHHDAITGTAKQHVTDDYNKRLYRGMMEGQQVVNDALGVLLPLNNNVTIQHQSFCPLINISVCNVTQSNRQFTVTVFNGMSQTMNSYVRIPYGECTTKVLAGSGKEVPSQVVRRFATSQLPYYNPTPAPYEVVLHVSVQPQGFQTYFITTPEDTSHRAKNVPNASSSLTLSNNHLRVNFDPETGLVASVGDRTSGLTLPFQQNFYWYRGAVEPIPSGAYVFRPNGTATPVTLKATTTKVTGPLVEEVRQVFNPWVSQVVRTYKDKPYVEFEWTIGPIPVEDNIGKEIITKYESNITNNGYCYTDANGRQILERRKNYQPSYQYHNAEPAAGNYFPVNSRIYIKFAGLKRDLPPNVNLLTVEQWQARSVLLRFEHTFQKGEDAELSKATTISLDNLFTQFNIVNVEELYLGANELKGSAMHGGKLATNVTLDPMQIRTFRCAVEYHH